MGTCVCCNLHWAEDTIFATADEGIAVKALSSLFFLALGMTLVC